MNKSIIAFLIVAVSVAGLGVGLLLVKRNQDFNRGAAAATDLQLVGPTSNPKVNDEFTVNVNASTGPNELAGVELYISYDATKLSFVSADAGDFLNDPRTIGPTDTNGVVFFTVTTAPGTAAKSGTGTVATLTFKAEAQGTSNLEITPDSLAVAIREGGNNVLQNRTGVAITVGTVGGQGDLDPTPSPTPTASPSPSPSPTAAPTKVSIGDRVWNDTNKDGIQDASENGIQGVTVSLLNGSGTVLSNTTTDPSGYYGFTNFDPGTYMIQFNLTSGFGFTTKDQGSDDAKDSDADPTTGKTGSITLSAGQVQYTWDAGFIASTTSTTSSSGGITFATPTATPLKTATPKPTSTASASGTPKPPSELPDTGMDAPTILALGLAGGVFLVGSGFYVASRKAE